jgi:succinyl-diaminopimelate desuccinylase
VLKVRSLRILSPAVRGRLAAVSALADRLAQRTLELVDIPSVSLGEAAVRERIRSLVPSAFEPVFEGDEAFLWARERRPDVPLLVLAGHYDTIPAQDNVPGRIDGGAVHGCGASDMKGGIAVALELVRDLAEDDPGPLDVALLLFGREELPPQYNPLPALFEAAPSIHEASLAVLLEPTDLTIQAGCVGNLSARVTFHGVSGHSARPWLADNAIHRAIEGLARVATYERREAVLEGLPFYEVLSVTRIEAGVADNVVPDRAVATLNFRYPPDRDPEDAERYLRSLVPTDSTVEILGNSPPAAVVVDAPLVQALREVGGFDIEPKQAWTNVADFTARNIPAVNFGPGATRYAHARDERVEIEALERAYLALREVARGPIG